MFRNLLRIVPAVALLAAVSSGAKVGTRKLQPELGSKAIPIISVGDLRFRDLNRDGKLQPYEDWRLDPEARAADLVKRMTLYEKAGTVMHANFPEYAASGQVSERGYRFDDLKPLLLNKFINCYLTRLAVTPVKMAEQNNLVQQMAEESRLGIPITISTDPRHHFLYITGQSSDGRGYSQWPETIGLAAMHRASIVQTFADIARREYRATGIHQALSPQVDLYTEPRWARGYGGFGSSPALSRQLARAYVTGFQGGTSGLTGPGVLTTIKHWVAYGATVNGFDSHNIYGQVSRVDKASFDLQVEPFLGGFDANVGAVMPTYSVVQGISVGGKPLESVGGGYSRQLLLDLLRTKYQFKGLVLSDWAITNDCPAQCQTPSSSMVQDRSTLGMPWGVESLSRVERFAKSMNAGVDQFGGVAEPDKIVAAVQQGLVTTMRLDEAVQRVLVPKFVMGLFENPYVDVTEVSGAVNPPEVAELASRVQAGAQVLLKNHRQLLPLAKGTRIYAPGISEEVLRNAGLNPQAHPDGAQVALVRLSAPFEVLHPYYMIGSRQHEGRLDFRPSDPDVQQVMGLAAKMPVISAIFMDRPAILGPVQKASSALLANFGVSDVALVAAITGRYPICGRLPFELPSSIAAVEKQDPAVPDDSRFPLYPAGAGLVGRCR